MLDHLSGVLSVAHVACRFGSCVLSLRSGCSDEITRAAPGGRARGRVRSLTLVDGLIRHVDDVGVSS